jgi:oligopeptidase A
MDHLLADARDAVERATRPGTPDTWEAFIAPVENANERLGRAWNQVSHLHAVMDAPELRLAYNENLPRLTQYWTELGQNEALFRRYRALHDSDAFAGLSAVRKRIVENALRDFRLGGAELPADQKPRYAKIQEELAALSAKFSENVLDATNAFSVVVKDEERVKGIPGDALAAARTDEGWKFTLHAPSYFPVIQYADDRALREEMYRASATRASEFGRTEWDNTALIARILELRREEAAMLGYANYAERSLVPKMANSPRQVLDFLEDLARRARPYAEKDHAELLAFARIDLGIEKLEAWDAPYASEKLRAKRYSFSNNEVKQYLPEDAVLEGLFSLIGKLYGVRIVAAEAPVWHEDVRFFEVRLPSGELSGRFYLDLYARETKRGGAWMDEAVSRRRTAAGVQTPLVYLNCNFSRPVAGKPAVFDHDEVMTLFHETGHGLHSLLTRQDELGVSGLAGVEWDAVELPSQFMENFCWEWEVLEPMTRHVDSGERLPRALFDKMLAAKNFQAGLGMLRQIEFSVFDMRLHDDFDPGAGASKPGGVLELLAEVRAKVAVMVPPAFNRFPNSFSHIFAGGYAAGYYSYKWAEVLSADAYGAFEEKRGPEGILDAATGARFRDEVLAAGGSRPAAESFRAFRGRDPTVDALLRHSGMISA